VKRALFLDRDGTLIIDKVYLSDPKGVELIAGAAEGLSRARGLGYMLFLFTNQSGIGRGLHTIEDTHRVNARMEELLGLPAPVFDGICIAPSRQHERLAEHVPGRAVVHEARRGPPQQVHDGGLRALADAGCLHGGTEVAEPPGGLAGRDEPVQMAALHADIPDAAHLTSEDRLEKLLQAVPFARAAASKVASELPIALETVVEAIDDHADARTAAKSCEEAGASGHRRPRGCARHAAHHRLDAELRQAGASDPLIAPPASAV